MERGAEMNATISLTADEIKTAIKEYVQRQGWLVQGQVTLEHEVDDDRLAGVVTYSATVQVRPVPPVKE